MQCSAMHGSLNCFKFLMLQGKISKDIEYYAIAGGNNDIINVLVQNEVLFNNCLDTCVCFHRNEYYEWLVTKYHNEIVRLYDCVRFYNYDIFFKYLSDGVDINEINFCGSIAFHAACIIGDLDLVMYLNQLGCDTNNCDTHKNTALHLACKAGYFSIVEYLIGIGVDISEKNCYNQSAKDIAKNNKLENIEFFLSSFE